MSPKRDHSRVQGELGALLTAWSRGRGEVGPEWRFHIAIPNEPQRPLVPDLAFVAFERLRGLTAVEILLPGDDSLDVASKIDVYLRGGSSLVIVVNPKERDMTLYDALGATRFAAGGIVRHEALPDLELPLQPFFSTALDLSI